MLGLTRRNLSTPARRDSEQSIARWDPWSDFGYASPFSLMRQFEREMDRLFCSFLGATSGMAPEPFWGEAWAPSVHVDETANEWVIRAELPGVDPQDVEITTAGEMLTIRAQLRQEQEDQQQGQSWSGRRYGTFQRTLPLPPSAQIDAVRADYRNGMLEIHLPKSEEAKRQVRRVPISAGQSDTQPEIEGQMANQASTEPGANGGAARAEPASGNSTWSSRGRSRKAKA